MAMELLAMQHQHPAPSSSFPQDPLPPPQRKPKRSKETKKEMGEKPITYINPHPRTLPLLTPPEITKQRNTTPTPLTKHVLPFARPVFISRHFVFAVQPFDIVFVGGRVDVQVTVFGADGAVAGEGGGELVGWVC